MKVSLEWLNDYIDLSGLSIDEIVEALNMSGTSVEEILKPWEGMEAVIGEVLSVEKHPNADNLFICRVGTGKHEHRLVTADPLVEAGNMVAVALPGCRLFDGTVVESRTIRGVESAGTMLSLQEIGLEEHSEGVWKIPGNMNLKAGDNLIERLKLDDTVLDLEITPNRPDELSHFGIARELSVLFRRPLKLPPADVKRSKDVPMDVKIEIEDEDGCYRYAGTIVKNVKINPSPLWMRRRLVAVGARPINNVVDATNYVLLELGHPIHAFDLEKIQNGKIVVKTGMEGKKVLLLDEKEYTLKGNEVLITDGEEFLALGGIMGGMDSGVTDSTTNILVEVAYFNPVRIRRTSKSLGIVSDASYRFERGVDPNAVPLIMDRVVHVIQEIAGGMASDIEDVYVRKVEPKQATLRFSRACNLLGMEIPSDEIERILNDLGFETLQKTSDRIIVSVPTFRPDVEGEHDLIEEVGRIHGYENLEAVPPRIPAGLGGRNERWKFREKIAELVRSMGFDEGVTFSMVDQGEVRISNPMTVDMAFLRSKIVDSLLQSLAYNARIGVKDVRLFEIGNVFKKDSHSETGVRENMHLGMVITGRIAPADYLDKREADIHYVKGVVEQIMNWCGVDAQYCLEDSYPFTPGMRIVAKVNDEPVAEMGLIDPEHLRKLDLKKIEVYAVELNLDLLFKHRKTMKPYVPLPAYPSIRRDVSILIPKNMHIEEVMEKIKEVCGKPLERIEVGDLYEGKGIPKHMRSVLLNLTFRLKDKTMRDEEANAIMEKVFETLKDMKLEIRGI